MNVRNQHFSQIDGLRGIAVLLVAFYHLGLSYEGAGLFSNTLIASLLQMGWMGVDLFFVISGFLITSILIETRAEPHYFRNFIMRRTLRIWPLYYAWLLLLIVIAPAVLSPVPDELQRLAAKQAWFWAYAANWLFALEGGFNSTPCGYFWSLAVEEQFYLLWPLVIRYSPERRLPVVCSAMLAGSLGLRLLLAAAGVGESSLYTITFTHLDSIAAGSLLATLARDERSLARLKRASTGLLVTGFAALLAVRHFDGSFKFWEPAMARYGLTCVALVGAMLLVKAHFTNEASWYTRLLSTRALVSTGRYSYALYLTHVPVGVQIEKLTSHWLASAASTAAYDLRYAAQAAAALALSWILSMMSWHLFEKHILKLKRHFA